MIPLVLLAAAAQAQPLDTFDDVAAWRAASSDGVSATATTVSGATDKALQLRYDFAKVSGYAFVRRTLPITFPANWEMRLKLRGTGGVNDLQIKFTDVDGTNVWWVTKPNFRPSAAWQEIKIRPRDVQFAWGPTTDKTLKSTRAVEIVVVRGRDGGAGTIEVDDWTFESLPPPRPLPAPVASDMRAIDGDRTTAAKGPVTIDFGGQRELGGVVLHWTGAAPAYAIEASDDRRRWRTLRKVTQGDGGSDPIALPDTETRYLRISGAKGLAEVEVKDRAWAETPNAFIADLARNAPRGRFPRGFTEQSYWTLVASDGGAVSGLIGEDGAIEIAKGGFSVEPFVVDNGRTIAWSDVATGHSLEDGYLPIPHALWTATGWTLDTSLFADANSKRLMARWTLKNTSDAPRTLRLVLAVRPFQVNPPAQFLSQRGGVSPISTLAWDGSAMAVATPGAIAGDAAVTRRLFPLTTPAQAWAKPFDQGALADPAEPGEAMRGDDPTQLASGGLAYDVTLAPGESWTTAMALGGDAPVTQAAFDAAHAATRASWQRTLGAVTMTVPAMKQPLADTVRSALAQVLMSRDGPALKPGTRSYDRSWIRDGAMMTETMLRMGVVTPGRAFADWYGPNLFANGKVPCCVDARGPDPVPENDSHGQYIHLVTDLYRYTGDKAALERDWPKLDAARRYMESLAQSERTAANQTPERRMLYGLMPPSISHEGYSAKAQYSLWDDFWALTGYKDAAFVARVLNKPEAAEIEAQRDRFQRDLHAAIAAAVKFWKIDYIPGATSMGDFDATSTTMGLDPAGEQARLDPTLLANTFDKQWRRVMARPVSSDWADYTPYELRNVSAMVRLGWRDRANRMLDFYMGDRRPGGWNGWAEVVGRDLREIRFLGDVPHAWVASDYIRAALDLFAYVDQDAQAIVLAGGLDGDWLAGKGSDVRGLRTPYGTVDLAMRAEGDRIVATIGGGAMPPGGFVLQWPLAGEAGSATIDGKPARIAKDGLHIPARRGPITVTMERQR
ncbi:discoidin domain-containing protein [uncultured Sphingomonas sp.]|uniref:galactose-binding domain-containing protein n=1 Tax=uncultured Sphingomonas sp. TaxID=158754 RepID=UPI0025E7D9AC|nr:discoidin domain-containing protein [uncultured Sphingomonas sp.]